MIVIKSWLFEGANTKPQNDPQKPKQGYEVALMHLSEYVEEMG